MINMSNVWPNHLLDWLWLAVFVLFVVGSYPHHEGGVKQ